MVIGLCGSCPVLCPKCPWSYVKGGRAAVMPTWSSRETRGAQHLWVELTWPGLSTEPRVCLYLLWLLAAGGPCLGRSQDLWEAPASASAAADMCCLLRSQNFKKSTGGDC